MSPSRWPDLLYPAGIPVGSGDYCAMHRELLGHDRAQTTSHTGYGDHPTVKHPGSHTSILPHLRCSAGISDAGG